MAETDRTLLGKPDIGQALTLNALFYTVQKVGAVDKDFKVSLERLFSLLTKAHVGLGNADNTSDEEKPISQATRQALLGKASTEAVWPIAQVQGLQDTLLSKIDQDVFDNFVGAVNQALGERVLMISFTSAINGINQQLQAITQDLEAIQANPYVTQEQLSTALSNVMQSITPQVQEAVNNIQIQASQIVGLDTMVAQQVSGALAADGTLVRVVEKDW